MPISQGLIFGHLLYGIWKQYKNFHQKPITQFVCNVCKLKICFQHIMLLWNSKGIICGVLRFQSSVYVSRVCWIIKSYKHALPAELTHNRRIHQIKWFWIFILYKYLWISFLLNTIEIIILLSVIMYCGIQYLRVHHIFQRCWKYYIMWNSNLSPFYGKTLIHDFDLAFSGLKIDYELENFDHMLRGNENMTGSNLRKWSECLFD